MKKLISMLLSFILFSCASMASLDSYQKSWDGFDMHYNKYKIEIISDPPGAVIEFDNEYIGKTPLVYEYTGWVHSYKRITVIANPIIAGQYSQIKTFILDSEGNKVLPRKMYFNMSLVPAKKRYEIDINKNDININKDATLEEFKEKLDSIGVLGDKNFMILDGLEKEEALKILEKIRYFQKSDSLTGSLKVLVDKGNSNISFDMMLILDGLEEIEKELEEELRKIDMK